MSRASTGILGELVHDERLGHALGDREQGVEARRRILEDEPQILAARSELALLDAEHLGAEHAERAAGDRRQPGDRAPDRGLARSALADESDDLTRSDREADLVDRAERGTAESAGVLDDELVGGHDGLRRALDGREDAIGDLEARHRGEQSLGVLVLRSREQLLHGRRLDDLAVVHDGDAIGQVGDDAHVVGDQHDRRAGLVAQLAQQVEDLGLHRDVERGRRLVGDDDRRVERERHRDDDALLLPAGELVRVVVDPARGIGDADAAEHLDRAGLGLALRVVAVRPQPLGELPARPCRPG